MTAVLIYIGHGRALEGFLGFYKLVLAVSILVSEISWRVPALADLTWGTPRYVVATPFAIIGFLQIIGLILNALGYEISWLLRFVGAAFAMMMWSALLIKSSALGEPTLVIPMAVAALPASGFLLYKAWNRLPVPGAAGLV